MRTYTPDKWKIVKIESPLDTHYRVFACWYGGFASGDSWKMNSGITSVSFDGAYYHFSGSSGSVYSCYKDSYGISMYGEGILRSIAEDSAKYGANVTEMPEDTDWLQLTYE